MAASTRDKHRISDIDLRLYVKDVDDPNSRKRPLTVKTWSTVKDVKDHVQKLLHVPPSAQRLYFGPIMTANSDLPNHRTLADAGIDRNGETLYLEIKRIGETLTSSHLPVSSSITTLSKPNDICVSKSLFETTPKQLRRIVQQARRGLALGLKPDLVLDGSGGTYFLHDARKIRVGVFKPGDEEPYAENNPRGHVRVHVNGTNNDSSCDQNENAMSMRAGIKPGEACLREVAAYLLDHESFTNVPMTTLAEARHPAFHSNGSMLKLTQGGAAVGNHSLGMRLQPQLGSSSLQSQHPGRKVGSFQEYVNGECCMDDLSPSKITDEEVHKIAVLDIRIMNADRNTANLICRRDPEDPDFFELVPIDHGYCLRTVADVCWFDWCWLDWPQMKRPVSQKTKDFILNLDIEADARMLKERLNIPDRALDYFRASNKILQAGIKSGMTLYDIAILCCRNDDAGELPSKLELLMSMADDISKSAIDNGRWHHIAASRALEQQLSPSLGIRRLRKTPPTIFKSMSSLDFSSFHSGPSNLNSPPPARAQSSGSESSTETDGQGSVDDEECEEWAAAFVANTLQLSTTATPTATRRQRSISFARGDDDSDYLLAGGSCEESLSSSHCESSASPVGFWFVPPSASKEDIGADDSTWSPHVSPGSRAKSPDFSLRNELDMEGLDLDKSRVVRFDIPNLIPPKDYFTSQTLQRSPNSFINDNDDGGNDGSRKAVDLNISTGLCLSPPRGLPMKRSNSYSAFSFNRIIDDEDAYASFQPRIKSSREQSEQNHHYFEKFIDLLIDREITPKIPRKQKA